MFALNSDTKVQPVARTETAMPSARQMKPPVDRKTVGRSVIGGELTIIGTNLQIVSGGLLQVDGEVQGDVIGLQIVVGPTGKVTGLVNAEEVVVEGAVYGTIKALHVKLTETSIMEGDLYHETVTLEQGASFEGHSRRTATREELMPTAIQRKSENEAQQEQG